MIRIRACTSTLVGGLTFVLLAGSTQAQAGSSSTVFGMPEAQACYQRTKLDTQRTGGALSVCTEALAKPGLTRTDRAHTLVNRATNLNNLKRYQAAMEDVEKALRLEPELAEAFVTRGNTFLLQGAVHEALDDYHRALALDLRDRHAGHVNRALTYHALKQHENAYADFRAAAEIQPDWALPREYIALYQKAFGFQ